ncbi:PLAC8 family [Novymonas esmeraldas]|uniref:PLAC8 family n=1 Tax=Novymonas esmeraldas TaxID=1808958 RepID=A0AAW0EKZ7_9TRYP
MNALRLGSSDDVPVPVSGEPAMRSNGAEDAPDHRTRHSPSTATSAAAVTARVRSGPPSKHDGAVEDASATDTSARHRGRAGSFHVPRPRQHQRFSSSLCSCHESWAVCCEVCLCAYCIASMHHSLLISNAEGLHLRVCCGLLCADALVLIASPLHVNAWACLCCHTCLMRRRIRQRYHLHTGAQAQRSCTDDDDGGDTYASGSGSGDGDGYSGADGDGGDKPSRAPALLDCIAVMCCLPCAIAQHQREILHRGDWCGGVFSNRHSLHAPTTVHTL